MAKYKLINAYGWRSYGIGFEIDTERSINGISIGEAESYVRNFPNDWELVSEEKLPEKWVIKITPENKNLLMKCNFLNKCINYDYSMGGYYGNKSYGSWTIPDGSTEISWDQFKRLVLKEEPMKEKEIIGYKLKDNLWVNEARKSSFLQGVLKIGLIIGDASIKTINEACTTKDQAVIDNFKAAGVLDLWFEPVYKESYPDITINGYRGEFFDNYVKFGCAEISYKYFCDIYNLIFKTPKGTETNREIESVTIGKGTFSKEQIKEIAEYYLNKK